jgi:hypothetical protein
MGPADLFTVLMVLLAIISLFFPEKAVELLHPFTFVCAAISFAAFFIMAGTYVVEGLRPIVIEIYCLA